MILVNKGLVCVVVILKLDGVGPVDNAPYTNKGGLKIFSLRISYRINESERCLQNSLGYTGSVKQCCMWTHRPLSPSYNALQNVYTQTISTYHIIFTHKQCHQFTICLHAYFPLLLACDPACPAVSKHSSQTVNRAALVCRGKLTLHKVFTLGQGLHC